VSTYRAVDSYGPKKILSNAKIMLLKSTPTPLFILLSGAKDSFKEIK
jgi:hypothetical protein